MNILQLCNKVPYPPHDGGSVATLNMAESFAESGCQITVLAMNTSKHHHSLSEIPDWLKQKITFIYIEVDTGIRPLHLLFNFLFSKQPYIATRFLNKKFLQALEDVLSNNTYSVVQIEGLYLMQYASLVRKHYKGIISYRAHNIENEIWKRIARTTRNPFRKYYFRNLAKRLYLYERAIVNQYDLLIPISDIDLNCFQETGNQKPFCLSYTGFSDNDFAPPKQTANMKDLFYIGALDWIPNQEALIWFTEKVWLPLTKLHDDFRFHVAGRNAPAWLERKLNSAGVHFYGEVENAHEFIAAHSIMIVPLFAGSGLRIKIIEAMAQSKPVITTTTGAQGLNVTSGKEILIADTAAEFIQAIVSLSENTTYCYELQKNAYSFARQNFDNRKIVKNLLYFYRQYTSC